MTYIPKTNTYRCNICKKTGFTKAQIAHPMGERHKCPECEGKPWPKPPVIPPNDPRRITADNGAPTANVFFRRMSEGELAAIRAGTKPNLAAAIDYYNTRNYRLWLSTSQAKCEAFGNENNDDPGVVVRVTFKANFSDNLRELLRPHQMQGTQNNPDVVAYHREGFVQNGNVSTVDVMNTLLDQHKHYNVGFTDKQKPLLNSQLATLVEV
jgi:hypothetical protein